MPLESCMLVLDNSEYMRNGDYMPTRFQAQAQAVSTVFTAKTDSNPESAVGLMTMAGKSPSLLVTPTNDIGKLLTAMNKSTIGGLSDLQTSIQIAQLALKHRENKNQRQRIVVFVGSPLQDSAESLELLGRKLRKNNVLVDIVVFGEEGLAEEEKLGALVEAAGGGESHLVSIPPGPHLLSDMIRQSPILGEEGGMGGGGGDESMGIDDLDPNMDPELAMAIRMSLQEAQEASARAAASQGEPGPSTVTQPTPAVGPDVFSAGPSSALPSAGPTGAIPGGPPTGLPAALTAPLHNAFTREPTAPGDATPTPAGAGGIIEEEDEDEEAMLARAMAMSRGEHGDVEMEGLDEDEEDEEAAIARAIQMSLEEPKGDGNPKP